MASSADPHPISLREQWGILFSWRGSLEFRWRFPGEIAQIRMAPAAQARASSVPSCTFDGAEVSTAALSLPCATAMPHLTTALPCLHGHQISKLKVSGQRRPCSVSVSAPRGTLETADSGQLGHACLVEIFMVLTALKVNSRDTYAA